MTDYTDRVQRLKVLWNRGRNTYTSFYTELDEARKEIGDDQFANWCFWKLHISLKILNDTAKLLQAADAAVIKRDWAAARAAEQAEKKAAAVYKRHVQAAERAQREAEAVAATKAKPRIKKPRIKKPRPTPQPVTNLELAQLLERCGTIERTSRLELGECYAAMKAIVKAKDAGLNAAGKRWKWGEWATAHIGRSWRDIDRCIVEFETSCLKNENEVHGENVVPLRALAG